jgi:DNA-directed RNA polymerase
VNGFSGNMPPDYIETIKLMQTFPDDEAIARLRQLDVRYILVHESYYTAKSYVALMLRVLRRSDLKSHGRFRDWVGWTELLELKSTDG